ncbi:ATP-binding protein [Cohnella lupini]|uniref:ATPase family protein associated with various cellular activities (AAA) n=1 Tax=Cohnella lupini TaxID=1294267 RepID=A0A3D9I4U7_9BACL|nr:ATP-binding protein [Cohnella lupini]RED56802.1 ATPase family protein associated with various cellular activities (AAA) [Cohnella lupini]
MLVHPEPYRNGQEHLEDELGWLEAGFRALLDIGGGNPHANPLLGSRGLVVTADELRESDPDPDGENTGTIEVWQRYIDERRAYEKDIAASAEASFEAGIGLPLSQLCSRLRLTVWERRFIVLCLAAEHSRKYEKWLAYFNDDVTCRAPTPDLAYRLLCDAAGERSKARRLLSGGGSLRSILLESPDPYDNVPAGASVRPKLKTALRLDERSVSFLMQTEELDARLQGIVTACEPQELSDLPVLVWDDPVYRSLQGLADYPSVESASVPFVHLSGPVGGGKRLRLRHLASSREQRLLNVLLRGLPSDSERAVIAMSRIVREAVLTDAVICLTEEHAVAGSAVPHLELWHEALNEYVRFSRRPIVCWTSNVKRQSSELPLPARAGWIYGEVGIPDASIRAAFWTAEALESEGDVQESTRQQLADKYRFTPGQIESAWRQAMALATSRGDRYPTKEDLETASRGQFRHRLAQLADRIVPARSWEDLVLAEEPYSLIKEACNRFQHRETVYERWGFGQKLPYGKGLSMLFSGPPGTGKTMAAEVIAGELGLELYRIDLSRIVSKYIGETEQRLSELFSEAENSGAILFFDEGDALFGKRTEVKDAHDKYANIEAAYLLQRIEAYDGVTILATNLLQNMDEALIRRMSFVVKFPFPGPAERELIFRAHLPSKAPLSEGLDLAFLAARLDVSGGYIKNIVLAAAFLAATDGKPIGMEHFVRAARQELRKMGKILVKETFAPYFDEFNETFG